MLTQLQIDDLSGLLMQAEAYGDQRWIRLAKRALEGDCVALEICYSESYLALPL